MILATGGIGKTFKVTSNSWEYTGDGHALALLAGAKLLNMEFVQFHPTGMVWPPSVRGLLVTESVRGDGGVLRNSEGKRFMFDYVPECFTRRVRARPRKRPTAGTTTRTTTGARPSCCPATRWPGPSTAEVKAGRGSPHGGVFLDIASPAAGRGDHAPPAVHVPPVQGTGRRGHHQGADGGRADLSLRDGRRRGGPRTPRRPACPACSPPARCRGGMHGSNRLGGNSLSDLLVFGSRAGMGAAEYLELTGRRPGRRATPSWPRRRPRRSRRSSVTAARTPTPCSPSCSTP